MTSLDELESNGEESEDDVVEVGEDELGLELDVNAGAAGTAPSPELAETPVTWLCAVGSELSRVEATLLPTQKSRNCWMSGLTESSKAVSGAPLKFSMHP